MDSLYAEATSVSDAHNPRDPRDPRDRTGEKAGEKAVQAAQSRLLESLMADLPARILEAAKQGKRQLELLAFDGNATYDGEYFFLYLLLGPRSAERHASPRVVPLLETLRKSLCPFTVDHIWRVGTVQNQVLVSWG